jgi:hypothetical protein
VKSTKDRQAERRQEKLDDVQRQIRDGSLVVRQMTAAERERNQPRPRKPKEAPPAARFSTGAALRIRLASERARSSLD